MDANVSERWEAFVAEQVRSGEFASADEVVEASMALMRARQAKLDALRATISASIARGGSNSAEDVRRAIRQWTTESGATNL